MQNFPRTHKKKLFTQEKYSPEYTELFLLFRRGIHTITNNVKFEWKRRDFSTCTTRQVALRK